MLPTDHVLRDAHAVLHGADPVLPDAAKAPVCSFNEVVLPDGFMLRRDHGCRDGSDGCPGNGASGYGDRSRREPGRLRRLLPDCGPVLPDGFSPPLVRPSPSDVLRNERAHHGLLQLIV